MYPPGPVHWSGLGSYRRNAASHTEKRDRIRYESKETLLGDSICKTAHVDQVKFASVIGRKRHGAVVPNEFHGRCEIRIKSVSVNVEPHKQGPTTLFTGNFTEMSSSDIL